MSRRNIAEAGLPARPEHDPIIDPRKIALREDKCMGTGTEVDHVTAPRAPGRVQENAMAVPISARDYFTI